MVVLTHCTDRASFWLLSLTLLVDGLHSQVSKYAANYYQTFNKSPFAK